MSTDDDSNGSKLNFQKNGKRHPGKVRAVGGISGKDGPVTNLFIKFSQHNDECAHQTTIRG